MTEKRIANLFDLRSRFLRSVHLERDYGDPSVFRGYVLTDFAEGCFERIVEGLQPRSAHRAWRMTGDYGSGKSSFALLLAHSFSGRDNFPSQIHRVIDFRKFGVKCPRLIPVLSTCSRRPLAVSILEAVHRTLCEVYPRGGGTKLAVEARKMLSARGEARDDQVIDFLLRTNSQLIADCKGRGLLLVLDELGKYLEYASQNALSQDVFLLQRLAEAASRSDERPLFVICLLHQGFNAYAENLDQSVQREWEKVAGRFEEIVFNQPTEQLVNLVASAINVHVDLIPAKFNRALRQGMQQAISLGWFGGAPSRHMTDVAARLFPLHPTVLPILIRIFRRFGQNERSLFSFLLSNEPFGLQAFAKKGVDELGFYKLHNLYDYVRTCFGHRLSVLSYRSHWNLIDSIIDSFATENELHIKILKTIGILNLLNETDLAATDDAIVCALADGEQATTEVKAALEDLQRGKRVLYDRGRARGLCLWPHTSVDLEKALEDARKAVVPTQRVAGSIKDYLQKRPIVARRHYIETGNLRYFDLLYCSTDELPSLLQEDVTEADGLIILPLCETMQERVAALEFAQRPELRELPNWLLTIPQPLCNLASLVQEVQRWEWVATNTLELNGDKYAREEVWRQKEAARSQLERRLQSLIGLRQFFGEMSLDWFNRGKAIKIRDGVQLLQKLSHILDVTYDKAPCINNELINRRSLSPAAAAARLRLIERMFAYSPKPYLNMSPDKKPPEMSIYLSVLKRTGLHRQHGDAWRIDEPPQSDKCRVLPALRRINEIIRKRRDGRVGVADLYHELRKPPFGVRDGVIPLLLTVFAIIHEQNIAFYKDGTFLREMNEDSMLLLIKTPESFEVQYCRVEGLRAEIYNKLLAALEIQPTSNRQIEILDVVKPLCVFVAQLPDYVRNTKRLSNIALAVREALLNARDPLRLLFADLPHACGFGPFECESATNKTSHLFVSALKSTLDELKAAYPDLHARLRKQLRNAFDLPGSFTQFRATLAERAGQVIVGVTEPKLKAFCLRLLDSNLPEEEWMDSIGSYLSLRPPDKWHDAEEELFGQELSQLAARFKHVESLVFSREDRPKNSIGVRLSITQASGQENEQVVHYSADEETQLREMQEQFDALLSKEPRIGLAAVARTLWKVLENGGGNVQ